MEVREDENSTRYRDERKTPTTSTAGDVMNGGSRRKAVACSGSKVIVSHSPDGSIARVVGSPTGSVSRLSSVGSGCSYSLSPDGSSVSCPTSDVIGPRQVSTHTHTHTHTQSQALGSGAVVFIMRSPPDNVGVGIVFLVCPVRPSVRSPGQVLLS